MPFSVRSSCLVAPVPRHRQSIRAWQPAAQNLPEVSPGQPVITKRFNVGNGCFNLLLSRAQQLNRSELHRVVLQLGFVDDALMQRQQNVAVVQRAIPESFHSISNSASRRANPNRQSIVFLLGAPELRRGTPDPGLALIE